VLINFFRCYGCNIDTALPGHTLNAIRYLVKKIKAEVPYAMKAYGRMDVFMHMHLTFTVIGGEW
jgi:hypothetical protein